MLDTLRSPHPHSWHRRRLLARWRVLRDSCYHGFHEGKGIRCLLIHGFIMIIDKIMTVGCPEEP